MKFLLVTVCLVLLAFALVAAVPATHDESILGSAGDARDDTVNPQDPQALLLKKILLLKKFLFWG